VRAKWKLVLWALAPLLVYTVAYWLWIPGVLQYDAWKRGASVSLGEAVRSAVIGYFLGPLFLFPALFLSRNLFYSALFTLLTAGWAVYLVKLGAQYQRARSP
jgi:hypothetical protein